VGLPYTFKPLWSPFVDMIGTRRRWVWTMQIATAVGLAILATAITGPNTNVMATALFVVAALSAATHDIAADGLYLIALREDQQKYFVGVRTVFFRLAMFAGNGPLVILAGYLEQRFNEPHHAYAVFFGLMAVLMAAFGLWHLFALPRAAADRPGDVRDAKAQVAGFFATFGSFFRKPGIATGIAFLLLYRLGEALLLAVAKLFMLDSAANGGLGLTTEQVGIVYGVWGIIALLVGGLLGGFLTSRDGLKKWLWPMMLAINLPDLVYVYLAQHQPASLATVQACVMIEQLGYGFGFTAYLLYMMQLARGEHQTAHYAICTGFMSIGVLLPGAWSGKLQQAVGYEHFFLWVLVATIPGMLVGSRLRIEDTSKSAAGA
jgi:PAT family beta-lactamase induction signal transducer AmpG